MNEIQTTATQENQNYVEAAREKKRNPEVEDYEFLQETFEDSKPLDFGDDRSWNYRCRQCDRTSKVLGRNPKCQHCRNQTVKGS